MSTYRARPRQIKGKSFRPEHPPAVYHLFEHTLEGVRKAVEQQEEYNRLRSLRNTAARAAELALGCEVIVY